MRCPFCDFIDTKVVDTRSNGNTIKRRRECISCQKRFTTYEKFEEIPLYIVKKDKRREPFDREKLLHGLTIATVKRNVSREVLERFVLDVEKTIQNTLKNEISTKELGEIVMEKLLLLDQVAYVRFVSVYKEFDDLDSFIEIVEKISNKNKE